MIGRSLWASIRRRYPHIIRMLRPGAPPIPPGVTIPTVWKTEIVLPIIVDFVMGEKRTRKSIFEIRALVFSDQTQLREAFELAHQVLIELIRNVSDYIETYINQWRHGYTGPPRLYKTGTIIRSIQQLLQTITNAIGFRTACNYEQREVPLSTFYTWIRWITWFEYWIWPEVLTYTRGAPWIPNWCGWILWWDQQTNELVRADIAIEAPPIYTEITGYLKMYLPNIEEFILSPPLNAPPLPFIFKPAQPDDILEHPLMHRLCTLYTTIDIDVHSFDDIRKLWNARNLLLQQPFVSDIDIAKTRDGYHLIVKFNKCISFSDVYKIKKLFDDTIRYEIEKQRFIVTGVHDTCYTHKSHVEDLTHVIENGRIPRAKRNEFMLPSMFDIYSIDNN